MMLCMRSRGTGLRKKVQRGQACCAAWFENLYFLKDILPLIDEVDGH